MPPTTHHPSPITRAAVIGHPIAHSLSPKLHGFWLKQYGMGGVYEKIEVLESELESFLRELREGGFRGINVTIPHKERVFALVDELDDAAKAIKAVNTVVVREGKLYGSNTDAYGFIAHLKQHYPKWSGEGKTALVLGAGGAAKAIIYGLVQEGMRVIIANRTKEKAEVIQRYMKGDIHVIAWEDVEKMLGEVMLLANSTALGMVGKPSLDVSIAALPKDATVADIVYKPLETDLLKQAKRRGLYTLDGLGMLMHQAAPGFEAWFGKRPEVSAELQEHLEKCLAP